MFTALVITKLVLNALYAIGFKDAKFYGVQKERKALKFMGKRYVFIGISLAVIAAGFISMGINKSQGNGTMNYSLEFIGGTSTTVEFDKDYTLTELDEDVVPTVADTIASTDVQCQKVEGTNQVIFKTQNLDLSQRETLNTMFADKFGVDTSTISSTNISSTISSEMTSDAIWAVVIATVCMLIYIWFRFSDIRFATSAILALVHDVLVVLTCYAVLRLSVGSTFIACMLTIIGYSINDTIVIFDRIRENIKGVKTNGKVALAEIANKSITQTISRSINTSLTTFVMVLLLYILGVASIKTFALPLMVGIVSGTYSSICIATELWFIFRTRLSKKNA